MIYCTVNMFTLWTVILSCLYGELLLIVGYNICHYIVGLVNCLNGWSELPL